MKHGYFFTVVKTMLEHIDLILFSFVFIEDGLQLNVSIYPQISPLMRRKAKWMMLTVPVVKSVITQTGCPSVHARLFVVVVVDNISIPFKVISVQVGTCGRDKKLVYFYSMS